MTELFRGIEFDHDDYLGRRINHGDSVVYLTAISRKFDKARVVGFTEKKVILQTSDGETVRYPNHLFVIEWELL